MKKSFKHLAVILSIVMLVCLFAPYGVVAETDDGDGTTIDGGEQGDVGEQGDGENGTGGDENDEGTPGDEDGTGGDENGEGTPGDEDGTGGDENGEGGDENGEGGDENGEGLGEGDGLGEGNNDIVRVQSFETQNSIGTNSIIDDITDLWNSLVNYRNANITPTLKSVDVNSDGTFTANWGYQCNVFYSMMIHSGSGSTVTAESGGTITSPGTPPNSFEYTSGSSVEDAFSTIFNGSVKWTLVYHTPELVEKKILSIKYKTIEWKEHEKQVVAVEPNVAPVATDMLYSTDEGTTLIVDADNGVLKGASDANTNATLTALVDTQPTNGTVIIAPNGSFTYIPNEEFVGTDTFTFIVSDGELSSESATVSIEVLHVNKEPIATNQYYTTAKNTELTVDVAEGVLNGASDADGDSLSALLESGPTNGTLVLNADGSFTYTPGQDFVGYDDFEFSVFDGVAAVSAYAYIKVGVPNVAITKTVDKPNAYAGDSVKYTVTVTNTGDTTLSNIIVYDDVMNKSWMLANLEPLSSSVITYNYVIPADKQVNDTITNTATVYASERSRELARQTLLLSVQSLELEDGDEGNLAEGENGSDYFELVSTATATVTIIARQQTQTTYSSPTTTYTLLMAVIGEGTVSPGTGTHSYSSGSTVQLSATPAEGWEFEGWQGDTVDASGKIVMNGDKSVTAVFSLIEVEEEMEDEPTPEAPAAEPQDDEILDDEETPAAPVDELPKTGGVPAGILYGLGGLIAAIGVAFGSKTKKKED